MLRCTEKLFAVEKSTVKLDNNALYQNNAMLRADQNFKFISAMIDHHFSQRKKEKLSLEDELLGHVKSVDRNQITCSQYIAALKALPAIYRLILPSQVLSLKTILQSTGRKAGIELSPTKSSDFVSFKRYHKED